MKRYEVIAEGWIEGKYRLVGETISLDVHQAKYLVMNKTIRPEVEAPVVDEPAQAKTAAKKKSSD
ncbi:MAG: hypothetical protein JJ902_05450 [Roseibium sp.]|nr:hypothetical protein [Roseibium sp.]